MQADRIAFIGDIHGWSGRLDGVLSQLEIAGHGEVPLVFLGDLVDRGPNSKGTVEQVRALCQEGRAVCIMGNHEYAAVRGLGLPERGIPPVPALFDAWWHRYGGCETGRSYGVLSPDAGALAEAMAEHLPWLADLPWVLPGQAGDQRFIAVHAGFDDTSLDLQLADAAAPERWQTRELPPILYAKDRVRARPVDIDADICIISGHTPVFEAVVGPARVLADTTGGQPGRALSAVILPEGRVLTAS